MRAFMRRSAAVSIGLILAGGLAATAWAAGGAGQLDPSFNGTGYATTDFGGGLPFADGVVVQGDKTIAVGGTFGETTNGDFALARYNKNGSLDTSFGNGGEVTTDFTGGNDLADAVAIMGDKIVVAGYTQPSVDSSEFDFALARYNKNGALDTSFGNGGKVVTSFGDGYDIADAIAVKGDRIDAGGFANGDFALAQYTKNGSLDGSFGNGGKVTTDFDGGDDSINGLAYRGDTIIAAGYANLFTGNANFALAAFDKRGALDPSFGTGGKVETDFAGEEDAAHAVDVHGDRIVAIGESSVGGNDNFAAAVYDKRGMLDASFNGTGKATLDLGGTDIAFGGAFGPDDTVVAAGLTQNTNNRVAVARWTKSGAPDLSFGAGGFSASALGTDSAAFALALGPDNRITVAGASDDSFLVARYLGK